MIKLTVNVTDARNCIQEPVFVESTGEISSAVQRAIDGFIEAHAGELEFPLRMVVHPSPEEGTGITM